MITYQFSFSFYWNKKAASYKNEKHSENNSEWEMTSNQIRSLSRDT